MERKIVLEAIQKDKVNRQFDALSYEDKIKFLQDLKAINDELDAKIAEQEVD